MAELKEARVPDIGNYDGVPVIEVLVAVGDQVKQDQGLVTLESDKATMEVPAPFAGVVREIKVKIGDSLAEGDHEQEPHDCGGTDVNREGNDHRGPERCRRLSRLARRARGRAGEACRHA